MSTADIESPCVRVCIIDAGSGWCQGCGRTLTEISYWTTYTPAERRRIMAELDGRLAGAPNTADH